jgi:hypothetical protein
MTPVTLNVLVTEMTSLKSIVAVSESCGRIRRLRKRGLAMNINAKRGPEPIR